MNEQQATQHFSTQELMMMALFTAALCVCAYITLTLPNGSHLSLLNFAVILTSLFFPASQGCLIIIVWMLLGIVGVPVFAGGNAGIGYLFGPYGGYNFAFLLSALLVPFLQGQSVGFSHKKGQAQQLALAKKQRPIRTVVAALFAVILIDLIGTFWLMIFTHISLSSAFLAGFVPFIPLDIVKAFVAAGLVPALHRAVVLKPQ